MLAPVNYAHLYMNLPEGEGRQTALREFQGIAINGPVTVSPGSRRVKMLFFQRPEKVGKDVVIIIGGLYLGGAQVKSTLSFKTVPLDK
jgi:hypothetical protein